MTPLLCICIPTFNREDELAKLLQCLDREIGERDDIVVQISDNASPDGTQALLTGAMATRSWLRVFRQEENLGPFRNIEWLVEHAPPANYLWLFGDDDLIVPGALATVIEILETERPVWLFLPHQWIDGAGRVVGGSPAPAALERFAGAGQLFRAYDHWLTFISASVVRADALREAVHATQAENAYSPLLYFFRAGLQGPCCVAPQHCVHGGQAISWSDRAHLYMTLHFTSLYDDGLHAGLSAAEFGACLDGLYVRDNDLCHAWRQIEIEKLVGLVGRFPQSEGLRRYLWTIALERGRQDLLPAVDTAARMTGAHAQALVLVAAGEELFAAGDAAVAVRRFREASKLAPTLTQAWNDLAVALHHFGRPEAVQAVDMALFVAPDDADALSNRAAILGAG
jgi:tetratricopeptide (TPR) repeat protein